MKNNFFKSLLLMLALLVHLSGRAEDVDLFMGITPDQKDLPNVLIALDNTANWNTAFSNEKTALISVVSGLEVDKFNLGLMLFSESGESPDGGYVRAAIRRMDATNKPKYAALVESLEKSSGQGDGGNNAATAKALAEAYLYFSGEAPFAGRARKADVGGNTFGTDASKAVYARPGNALASANAAKYTSPIPAGSCARNFVIYISNGPANENTNSRKEALDLLIKSGGSEEPTIRLVPNGDEESLADEWARFMRLSKLGVAVYTIEINRGDQLADREWTAVMKSVASVSNGKYFSVSNDATEVTNVLNSILSEIQSVSSVFASVSLPVSANTQGDYLDQVFIGMFLPDKSASPRWTGNLKQYKLGLNGESLQLQDANSEPIINYANKKGDITACARSFWTPEPSALDTEWASKPSEDYCLNYPYSRTSNSPDGNNVDKGGQAYVLRQGVTAATRNVKTCTGSCASVADFNTSNDNITQSALGAADATERSALINWARGEDNYINENQNGSSTDNRLSMHGDVVHSRPVAINFGSAASPNVVVFYGGNDGMLRAINGNRTQAIGSIAAGGELWSFMPPEFYTSIKRQRLNNQPIRFPSSKTGVRDPLSKPYGMDGAINAYKGPVSAGGPNRMFIYATMRRGGRAIYGFDVSNTLTNPTTPELLWKIGCPNMANDDGCSSGTEGMGQTWSAVKAFTAAGFNDGVTPLIIMGGGYDNCQDYDNGTANHNCTRSSKGHYVYVFNGLTGNRLRTFDTGDVHGIIGDVVIAPDSNGKAKYGYTADLGGNVYRINFAGGTSDWTMKKIASLGCDTLASCAAPRKFMFAPSVAEVNGNYALMIGSGDREKPLDYFSAATSVSNLFFMFTDKPDVSSWPGTEHCGGLVPMICKRSLFGITTSADPTPEDLAPKQGWYLALASKEQVVTSALTLYGTVSFRTHFPPEVGQEACTPNLGEARSYNVNFANAKGIYNNERSEEMLGGGLGVSGVGGVSGGRPFCIGCRGGNYDVSEPPPPPTVTQPKGRLYWYLQR